mgnify:CR=1 FL=1
MIRTALEINVVQGRVAGIPLARLGTNEARNNAYALLAAEVIVPPLVTEADHEAALSAHVFFETYDEPNPAVTQNPGMAASMGINPDRINMLTFGFGSGIAGIAGVAIGLYAKVASEMGSDYIVQSFMTVVVGGVGNVWGTLAGASMIGFLQKGIEWLNPSNTLAAQTYMILFIILFIQFRPKGIVALKGRATAD